MAAIVALIAGLALAPTGPAPTLQGDCLRALSALPAGSVPLTADFEAVDCPRHQPATAFRHDAMQSAISIRRFAALLTLSEADLRGILSVLTGREHVDTTPGGGTIPGRSVS